MILKIREVLNCECASYYKCVFLEFLADSVNKKRRTWFQFLLPDGHLFQRMCSLLHFAMTGCELAASFVNPLSLLNFCPSLWVKRSNRQVIARTLLWNYRYPSSWVITSAVLLFKCKANCAATAGVWGVELLLLLLCRGTISDIPQSRAWQQHK